MTPISFKKWNTILGWFSFAVALLTYSLTVEPTLSFWDCGEYIATSANLEVGHPPGAPLFQMLGAFFAMFALSASKVALMVNMMSVFSSAFTILFMFWSLTMLLKKIVPTDENPFNYVMILGSSLVAAMAYTFTDSFWYNAVEAEVYAMASLFIALLFWLGLRWEQDLDTPKGNKWLLLISLVIGLSFGVHFMALLTIPAIGFLYYFKKYKTITITNFIVANVLIVAVLLFIFKLLLPYTLALFGKTEIFMVNTFGLPFNSGTIFMTLLLIAFFYFGLNYTQKKGLVLYNTLILCVLFLFIGFSTWLMLPIRANANVIINENKPSDAAEVLAYYNREQYGEQKLFYGPQFSDVYAGLDPNNPYSDDKPNYERDYQTGTYIITNNFKNAKQNSHDDHKAILPRMWSSEHAENYMMMTHPLEFHINPEYNEEEELVALVSQFRTAFNQGEFDLEDYHKFLKTYGEYLVIEKPTTADNLSFMFKYQFGYMYWRYLLWNFAGRQNDVQGNGDDFNGNWLSGINFIDERHIGSQKDLTTDMKNNKARNVYFFLPFILAVIGLVYHAKKDLKSFYVLVVLFLFMGFALKVYLNERPFEPRERDYALVGSFMVFAMWIAYGIYAVYESIQKYITPKTAGIVALIVSFLAAPALLAFQNYDDHNRSGKYTTLASAKAYLDSCETNAILFTIGDNDTFPLWYAQEIEGYRTDVRVVCTTLLMTDWYINSMRQKAYESNPMPISFAPEQYRGSKRDYCVLIPQTENRWELADFLHFIKTDDERAQVQMKSEQWVNYYPTNKIRLTIDKNKIIKNKIVSPQYYDSIVPAIDFEIKGDALYKNRLFMLDILQHNDWERPIYFTGGSFADDDYMWMKDYLQLNGLTYKLVPVKTPIDKENPMEMGDIDTEKMYNVVTHWYWGNSESPNIYHDTETRRNSITYRTVLARLSKKLIEEGKIEKAKTIIDLAMQKMPLEYFDYYTLLEPFIEGYYDTNQPEKARKIADQLIKKHQERLTFFSNYKPSAQNNAAMEIVTDIERYRSLVQLMEAKSDTEYYAKHRAIFNTYNQKFSRFQRDNE